MDDASFDYFREVAYATAGIALSDGKQALVASRLASRLRALQLPDERAYVDYLRADTSGAELVQFLDVISTNFTSFFRERDHFDELGRTARRALSGGRRRFRYWCAASSSGEEPWSMAMTLAEELGQETDWRILATDISTRVLRAAERGVYTTEQTQTIPPELRAKWMVRQKDGTWSVSPALRPRVVYRRLNLATPPYPMQGPLDAVFCRNVMIYFDNRVRQGLISEVERLLEPGGLLCIGHTETLTGVRTALDSDRPSVYRTPRR